VKVANKPAAAALAGAIVVLGTAAVTRLLHPSPPITAEEASAATLVVMALLYWLVPGEVA